MRLPHRVPKPLNQALQQTAAAILVLRGFKPLSAAATAGELWRWVAIRRRLYGNR
jgi:hypothetical protein